MKSLEEIYVDRTVTHLERGTDGISRQVTRNYRNKLTVKTINAGLRFVHLIVDLFVIQILMYLLDMIPLYHRYFYSVMGIIMLLLYPLFYAVCEYKFQQTPGKMLTGYVVINQFAEKPDFRVCLLRSIIRLVPFEGFSCMDSPSRGWHDRWTKTYVVNKEEVPKLKALLEKQNSSVAA